MKILYAEDEISLATATSEILKMEGFDVVHVLNGQQALDQLENSYFDICVFDIMMPIVSGTEALVKMRDRNINTPVLLLTAKTTLEDKLEGLQQGADDYLCKPFEMKELVARIKSIERRSSMKYKHEVLKYKNIELDVSENKLRSDNSSLILTMKETHLLALFIKNPGKVFNEDEINIKVMGDESSPSAPKLYCSYLKNKLNQVASEANIDDSYGYIFE